MYVLAPEFQKNRLICFKSSNLAFEGQKVVLPVIAHCSPEYVLEIRYRTFIWHIAWHSPRLSSKWNLIELPPHVQCAVMAKLISIFQHKSLNFKTWGYINSIYLSFSVWKWRKFLPIQDFNLLRKKSATFFRQNLSKVWF